MGHCLHTVKTWGEFVSCKSFVWAECLGNFDAHLTLFYSREILILPGERKDEYFFEKSTFLAFNYPVNKKGITFALNSKTL